MTQSVFRKERTYLANMHSLVHLDGRSGRSMSFKVLLLNLEELDISVKGVVSHMLV